MLESLWRVACEAQTIWAQILALPHEQGSLPLGVLASPSVNSANLMEEQTEYTQGGAWPSAGCPGGGANCPAPRGPCPALKAATYCREAAGRNSLGQARMLAEDPTLMGTLPALGEEDTLKGESPTLILLHLGLLLLYLSPLPSERCTDLRDHSARTPHLQKTEVRARHIE